MILRYFCFVLLLCATVSAYDLRDLNSDIQLLELMAKTDEDAALRKLSELALPTKIPLIIGASDAYIKQKIGDALTPINPLVLKGLTDLRGDWDEGYFGLLYYLKTTNELRSFLFNYVANESIGFSRTRLYDVAFRHGLLDSEFRQRALIDFERFKNRGATGLCGVGVEWGFNDLIPYYQELLERDVKCEDSSSQHMVLSGYAISAEAFLHFNDVNEQVLVLLKMRLDALEKCALFNE